MSSAGVGIAGRRVPASAIAAGRARDHRFFTAMAVAAALTVFIGFAPTYYLRGMSDSRPLPGLVHLHAMVSTSWMLLFLVQTSLVSVRRTDVHRRLGMAGAVLAVLVLVVGYLTAIEAARRGDPRPDGVPPLAFLAVPLGTLVAFAALAGLGLAFRSRPETHKRLMLLATIAMLTPALARFRHYFGTSGPPIAIAGTSFFVVACGVYDRLSHRRVHPAFLWGGLFLVLSLAARFGMTRVDAWLPIARWLTR
jgi:hypothetical protein